MLQIITSHSSIRVSDEHGVTLKIRDSFVFKIGPQLWKKWKRWLWAGICFLRGGGLL